MSRTISKNHQGKEIIIGELAMKKNHNPDKPNEMVALLKIFHAGPGSEEDFFIFHFNSLLKDWILQVEKSVICIDMKSNHRLHDEIYSTLSQNQVITIQEFTDLLCEKHFEIFVEASFPTNVAKRNLKYWLKNWFRNA
jgi:hypothetical protein